MNNGSSAGLFPFHLCRLFMPDVGLLSQVQLAVYSFPNESVVFVPFFDPVESDTAAQQLVLSQLRVLSGIPLYEVHSRKYETYYMLPTGIVDFEFYNATTGQLKYGARVNDNPEYVVSRGQCVMCSDADSVRVWQLHPHAEDAQDVALRPSIAARPCHAVPRASRTSCCDRRRDVCQRRRGRRPV